MHPVSCLAPVLYEIHVFFREKMYIFFLSNPCAAALPWIDNIIARLGSPPLLHCVYSYTKSKTSAFSRPWGQEPGLRSLFLACTCLVFFFPRPLRRIFSIVLLLQAALCWTPLSHLLSPLLHIHPTSGPAGLNPAHPPTNWTTSV